MGEQAPGAGEPMTPNEEIDEAIDESFPGSDPPTWSRGQTIQEQRRAEIDPGALDPAAGDDAPPSVEGRENG